MRWNDVCMPLLDDVLESELVLSKQEVANLNRAVGTLAMIRKQLEQEYGEDDAFELPEAEPWISAASYLSEALDNLAAGALIKLPARPALEK